MQDFVRGKIEEINLPHFCRTLKYIGEGKVYIYPPETDMETYTEAVDDIFVPEALSDTFNAAYFNTVITGKKVYAPLHLYGGFLPVSRGVPFLVLDEGESVPADDEWNCKEVVFGTETTIADLYRNAASYQYSADTDTYIALPEQGALQNKLKLVMQKRVMEIGGDAYDRIADLSRMVLFLLSKVTLTEDEQTIIAPTLAYAQTASQLADVFNREKHIQSYVAKVKSDPGGYINGTTDTASAVDTNTDES